MRGEKDLYILLDPVGPAPYIDLLRSRVVFVPISAPLGPQDRAPLASAPGASGTTIWNPRGARNPNLDLLGLSIAQEPSGPDFWVSDPPPKSAPGWPWRRGLEPVWARSRPEGLWRPFRALPGDEFRPSQMAVLG